MDIKITGRHINVSDKLRRYAEEKLAKLEKYFHRLIGTHLIFYKENMDNIAEVIISGDSVRFHGKEKSGDFYSAIDLLVDKLESQIGRYKDRSSSKKGGVPEMELSSDIVGEGALSIQLKQVSNKPLDNIEAYLQMKVADREFILFKKGVSEFGSEVDYLNKNYAVIFKDGAQVKMFEVPFEMHREVGQGECHEYKVEVHDESISRPKIDFNKLESCSVLRGGLDEALNQIMSSDLGFLPFYNVETGYLNVLVRAGNGYEVVVPAF